MSCNKPYLLKVGADYIQVPCRNCIGCRIDNRNMWEMRTRYEAYTQYKQKKGCSFTTLTYTTENTPITEDGRMTLRKSDIQKFMKRMRKYLSDKKIKTKFKYILCGEYGGMNGKPHYHIIFLGLQKEIVEKMITTTWREGLTQTKTLMNPMIRYTLKYMDKQIPYKERKKEEEKGYEAQFILRSKGIGEELYQKMAKKNVYINTKIAYAPKYWRKKYDIEDKKFDTLKLQFQKNKSKREKLELEHYIKDCREAREFNNYVRNVLQGKAENNIYKNKDRVQDVKALAIKAIGD